MASGVKTVLDDIGLSGNPEKKCATNKIARCMHGGKRAYQNKKKEPDELHSRKETMIYIAIHKNSK
jgi:hypothetical protein